MITYCVSHGDTITVTFSFLWRLSFINSITYIRPAFYRF